MSESEALEFLAGGHTLQVATVGADGYPHLAPMWYILREGKVTFRSFTKSQKIVNLKRNPRLTVLVETGDSYEELRGVMIKGLATLVDDRDFVLEIYRRLAAKYSMVGGEQVNMSAEALEAAFGDYAAKNTAVVVEPERVISWDHTKLAGAY
jgi:PPOX class probable F420-dependent enzyme